MRLHLLCRTCRFIMRTLAHTQRTYAGPGRRTVQAVGILKLNKVTEFDISAKALIMLFIYSMHFFFYSYSSSRRKPNLNFRCHESYICWFISGCVMLQYIYYSVLAPSFLMNVNLTLIINTLYLFSPILFFLTYYMAHQDNCANGGCQEIKLILFTFQKFVVY